MLSTKILLAIYRLNIYVTVANICQVPSINNHVPYFANNITSKSIITAIPHGNITSFSIDLKEYAFDNDSNPKLGFGADTDIPSEDFSFDNGVFIWNFTDSLRNTTLTHLLFIVFDQFNTSSTHSMFIRYCGCEHGLDECTDFPEININTTKEHVVSATCNCEHYTGEYCEIRENPCDRYICVNGCNNTAEIGVIPCLPCEHGYEGDGTTCTDINECEVGYSEVDKCSQLCNNTIGSFICHCTSGYVLAEDNHTCTDINECIDEKICSKPHHEICVNSPGNYTCVCMPGYLRKKENGPCEEIGDGAMYVGTVTFQVSNIKTSDDINKTVDTVTNRRQVAKTLDKIFNGIKGFMSVEVYKLTIILATDSSGRKKRQASSTGTLNADYVVHWQTTNTTEAVIASLGTTAANYKLTDTTDIILEGVGDVKTSTARVTPKTNNGTRPADGLCSVPDKTDCDTLSTDCQNKDGGFTCLCKSGFKEVPLSDKYCTDINECTEDSTILERCKDGHGSCINQVGSWNCTCPSQRTWQDVGNATYPVYRCQGNYSYIGFTHLTWRGGNNTEQIKLVIENELVSLYRNESLEESTYVLPISDLMVSATALDVNQTRFKNGSIEITAIFNLQMGEIVNVSRVADVIQNVTQHVGLDNNATFKYFHIYDDSENMLCNLTDQGGCDLDSSVCQQQHGSTVCSCIAGFQPNAASDKFCSDINECERYSSNETCSGLGECRNKHLGYTCDCKEGYFENAKDPFNVTCEDVDECQSDKYKCDMGTCTNIIGGWDCQCNGTGYIRKEITTSTVQCTDIDECNNKSYHCGGSWCTNTVGAWECTCGQGYSVIKNNDKNTTCEDVDECVENPGHCIGGKCVNSVGSWSCHCNQSTYQPVNISADTYRCMGDFQYVGEISLVSLQSINTTVILDLLEHGIMDRFKEYNNNINLPTETVKISEIFKTIEVLNKSINISYNVANVAVVKYIIHIGEPLTFDVVNSTFTAVPNLKDGDHNFIKVTSNVIFSDNEYNLCNIENKTRCDLETTDCVVSRGSYRCTCKDGYTTTTDPNTCTNIDECLTKTVTCGGGGTCRDTIGNWTCECNSTTEFHHYNNTYGVCKDKDECAYKDKYKCLEGTCRNKVNGWDCTCADGYYASTITKDFVYSCIDVDECNDTKHVCSSGGTCRNYQGHWTCDCPSGYSPLFTNKTFIDCHDIDECSDSRFTCDGPTKGSAKCINTPGSWQCYCSDGFNSSTDTEFVKTCADIDECLVPPTRCHDGGKCVNSIGNYSCSCPSGYDVTKFTNGTLGYTCKDIDECTRHGDKACLRALSCENTPGNWICTCSDGLDAIVVNSSSKICGGGYQYVATISFMLYKNVSNYIIFNKHLEQKLEDLYTSAYPGVRIGIELVSDSVTGLTRNNTDSGVLVSARYLIQAVEPMNKTQLDNAEGYYKKLKCPTGPCNIDEIGTNPVMFQGIVMSHNKAICDTSRNVCDMKSSTCISNGGQLDCDCRPGFIKTLSNSFQCTDKDECSNKSYVCDGGTCQNTVGGWDCVCAAGYQQSRNETGTNIKCLDIDECSGRGHSCTNGGSCVNTKGSWDCKCPKGFEVGLRNMSMIECKDINECNDTEYSCTGLGDSAVCSNTVGGWSCGCKTGYTLVEYTSTNQSCKGGEYSYTCAMTLTVQGGTVNKTAITIELRQKIELLYANTLHEQTLWIEIISINTGESTVRRKREAKANSKLSVKYIVHTSEKRQKSQLTEVLNKTSNAIKPFSLGNLTVQYDTVVQVPNSESCSKCNTASTTCKSTNDSFSCTCKAGFVSLPDNDYECTDINECVTNNICWNGSRCENTPGNYSCPCNDGYKLYLTESKEQFCAEPCSMAKCHGASICTPSDNEDGYQCGCAVGRMGVYCEKTEETGTSDKTMLIAVGSTLGGLVIVLCIVVFVVCRWRAGKIKEAEKMSMKYVDNSAFKDFDDEYLNDQYMRKQDNGSVYSHRISNGTFQRGNLLHGATGSYVNDRVNNPVYNKPQKLFKAQHRSSMPDLENAYRSTDRNGRQDSANHGQGQFASLERGRYRNGVNHQYPNGYRRNGGNGRSSPEPDYEPRRSPRPDYRSRDSPNISRDSGVGNGYHGNGFFDDDVHKGVHNGRGDHRSQTAIRTSTKF